MERIQQGRMSVKELGKKPTENKVDKGILDSNKNIFKITAVNKPSTMNHVIHISDL